jgi:hypothetical protein
MKQRRYCNICPHCGRGYTDLADWQAHVENCPKAGIETLLGNLAAKETSNESVKSNDDYWLGFACNLFRLFDRVTPDDPDGSKGGSTVS